MSTSVLIWVVFLSGAGTFLIRFLPMLWRDKGVQSGVWAKGPLRSGLNAIGPAAIVALLVAVSWS
ncbi:MAG: branched-chain amino acid transport, partial [Burkholderiaceae bacterium]